MQNLTGTYTFSESSAYADRYDRYELVLVQEDNKLTGHLRCIFQTFMSDHLISDTTETIKGINNKKDIKVDLEYSKNTLSITSHIEGLEVKLGSWSRVWKKV